MSLRNALKELVFKKPLDEDKQAHDQLGTPAIHAVDSATRPSGTASAKTAHLRPVGTENPYLAARRSWNEHVGALVSQRQTWQFIGLLSMLITLAAVGGMIHIGSQSRFIPYVVQVDKLGQAVAAGPINPTEKTDPRIMHAALADWIACARMVTPDVALQRKCVYKVYAMLAANDPATPKMNEWLNGSEQASPFKRAALEMVSVEIRTVIAQTEDTWQVEWLETTRDRQGTLKTPPVVWRSLVTTYQADITPQSTDEQLRNNPLGIQVRDFSWSRVQ